jgi:hypothetical protein
MRISSTDCDRWREAIRAWVGEVAAGDQSAQIQNHLAACADCRRYAQELRAAAGGLRWLAEQPVEPSPGFRARWTRAVEDAARPTGLGETAAALAACWRELLFRNRRPALAIASVWILVLLFRLSAPDVSPTTQTTAARSPVEIYRALKAPERLLAGELGQPIAAPAASQKPHSARPRSEGLPTEPTAHVPHVTRVTYVTCLTLPSHPHRTGPPVV